MFQGSLLQKKAKLAKKNLNKKIRTLKEKVQKIVCKQLDNESKLLKLEMMKAEMSPNRYEQEDSEKTITIFSYKIVI